MRVRVTSQDGAVHYDGDSSRGCDTSDDAPVRAAEGQGFHTVEATLLRDGQPLRVYRSGFWMRDWNYLLSGPKLTVGPDYFELDGKPLPVVGTTYMSGDVSRMYLMQPNAYVWDAGYGADSGAGLNMIRTGLWTAWKPELAANGHHERRWAADHRGVPDVRAA